MTPESRATLIFGHVVEVLYFKNINISKIHKMSIFETYHLLPFWLGFNGFDSTCGSKSMNITFFRKICWNYDIILQKMLTLSQNLSHGTNFDIVLCIKN